MSNIIEMNSQATVLSLYRLPAAEVISRLNSDIANGLAEEEARRRLQLFSAQLGDLDAAKLRKNVLPRSVIVNTNRSWFKSDGPVNDLRPLSTPKSLNGK